MLTSDSRLRDFPSLEGIAYLNTAAESIPPIHVAAAINDYWQHKTMGMRGASITLHVSTNAARSPRP